MKIEIEIEGEFLGGHLVYNTFLNGQMTITSQPVPVPKVEKE